MSGIFGDYFNPQYSGPGGQQFTSPLAALAAAQYRPTPAATFPNPAAAAPGPLAIPPAQPPIFLSPPNPAGAAPTSAPDSIGQGLATGINNHALTLMALGAGIAQGGVGRGLALASTAAEAERNRQVQQLNFLQTYKALTDAGVPAPQAQAAIGSPSLMRALAAKYLGPRSSDSASSPPAVMPNAPIAPTNVPNGAAYSPSRSMWKDADGNLFDQQGKPVT